MESEMLQLMCVLGYKQSTTENRILLRFILS